MARDAGLEILLGEDLAGEADVTSRPMFGGLVWLCHGHLALGVRADGLLARLGPGRAGWALALPGIRPMTVGPRSMPGWIWAAPDLCGDDALRGRLVAAALAFARALPAKKSKGGAVPLDLLGVRDVPANPRRR